MTSMSGRNGLNLKSEIHIVINILTVCYNSAEFVNRLCGNVAMTCGHPYRINVVDNGSDSKNMILLDKLAAKNKIFLLKRKQANIYAPSRHHGEAIHFGLDDMKNEDLVVIVDCDSAFIMKEWGKNIVAMINDYDHITCKRPMTDNGCGAWFSAFKLAKIREAKISFLPMLKEDGSDDKRLDKYDVGSDLSRLANWKPIEYHKSIRFFKKGHVWMLDGKPFIDHMGMCRSRKDLQEWNKWLFKQWRI